MDELLDLAAHEPGYSQDPYPLLGRIQAEAGTCRVLVDGLPAWLLTRYEDVRSAAADPRLSVDPDYASPEVRAVPWLAATNASVLTRHMLRTDQPAHTRLRALVSKAFTPRRIERLRPRVQEIVDELIDGFAPAGHVDLVGGYALPMPLLVICELLGVPAQDRPALVGWINTYAGVEVGDAAQAPRALAAMQGYLSDLITVRERHLPHDTESGSLLDGLIAARDGAERLSHDELHAMAFLLLAAGFETTANLIANGVLALLRSPQDLTAIRAQPHRIGAAIEEFMRYDPPVKLSPAVRFAKEDAVIGGVAVAAGDAVLFSYAAVNHDPTRFPDPDRLDLSRDDAGHLAFGYGVHYCLGAPLARMEGVVAIATLLERCPNLTLAEPPESLSWRHSRIIRSLRELPVTFTAG